MKYVLVHWSATNDTTVLTEEFVRDKTMLKDPEKEGMVLYGTIGAKLAAKFRPAPSVAILKSNPVDAWAGVGTIKPSVYKTCKFQ